MERDFPLVGVPVWGFFRLWPVERMTSNFDISYLLLSRPEGKTQKSGGVDPRGRLYRFPPQRSAPLRGLPEASRAVFGRWVFAFKVKNGRFYDRWIRVERWIPEEAMKGV